MNILKTIKGLTLVEIVVSIAIFGVMAVVFLNVFLGSLVITTRAGSRSDSVAAVSGEIEQKLADFATNKDATYSMLSTEQKEVKIIYNNGTSYTIMSGVNIIGNTTNEKGQTVEIITFVPGEPI